MNLQSDAKLLQFFDTELIRAYSARGKRLSKKDWRKLNEFIQIRDFLREHRRANWEPWIQYTNCLPEPARAATHLKDDNQVREAYLREFLSQLSPDDRIPKSPVEIDAHAWAAQLQTIGLFLPRLQSLEEKLQSILQWQQQQQEQQKNLIEWQQEQLRSAEKLDNFKGHLCARDYRDAAQGYTIEVWLAPDTDRNVVTESVYIRDGNDIPGEVRFEVEIDVTPADITFDEPTQEITAKTGVRSACACFYAPRKPDPMQNYTVWVRLCQKNRLIQVVQLDIPALT